MSNITVVSVKRIKLEKAVPVYDATVPKYHNFALGNGVFVHNTAKKARDTSYQEVLKLTGKPANAIKTKLHALLLSKPIQNILTSIGYNFDTHTKDDAEATSKLRVGSIYLLPDADVDGKHITTLLIALLYKFMPKLFEEGRVFIIDAPLFSAYYKGTRYYGETNLAVQKQLPKGCGNVVITRAKGWGEIGAETLAEIAFNPYTRRAVCLKPLDGKKAKEFLALMGKETDTRKKLLGI